MYFWKVVYDTKGMSRIYLINFTKHDTNNYSFLRESNNYLFRYNLVTLKK